MFYRVTSVIFLRFDLFQLVSLKEFNETREGREKKEEKKKKKKQVLTLEKKLEPQAIWHICLRNGR